MKTTLLALVITLAATLGFVNSSFAQASGNTFQISNQQSQSLGEVTISTEGGNYYTTVPGNTNDTVAVADTAISITINGQTVPQGVKAIVTLTGGTQVAVMWVTPNYVVIIDEGAL